MALTIQDLKSFVRSQSTRDFLNYDRQSWIDETNMIRRQRAKFNKRFRYWWNNTEAELIPGTYFGTRLIITENDIDYIPGQYAPTEIWHAVYDYFDQCLK